MNHRIPKEAKCVYEGEIFKIFQWKQKMYDGTYKTFEMGRTNDVVFIIPITENNKILLTIEEQPHLPRFINTPAGGLEENETFEEGALRELQEETGYSTNEKLIEYYSLNNSATIDSEMKIFIAKNCKKICNQKLDSGEKIIVKEIEFKEFLQECQKDNFRNKILQNLVLKLLVNNKKLEEFKKLLFS